MKRRDVLILAGALPLGVNAQVSDLADAINKAGRQRMLSQRMGKAWLAMVHNTEGRSAQAVLDKSMALFDRQLVELKAFAPSSDIRETYTALEVAWSDYKTRRPVVLLRPGPAARPVGRRHLRQADVGRVRHQREPAQRDGPRHRALRQPEVLITEKAP